MSYPLLNEAFYPERLELILLEINKFHNKMLGLFGCNFLAMICIWLHIALSSFFFFFCLTQIQIEVSSRMHLDYFAKKLPPIAPLIDVQGVAILKQ